MIWYPLTEMILQASSAVVFPYVFSDVAWPGRLGFRYTLPFQLLDAIFAAAPGPGNWMDPCRLELSVYDFNFRDVLTRNNWTNIYKLCKLNDFRDASFIQFYSFCSWIALDFFASSETIGFWMFWGTLNFETLIRVPFGTVVIHSTWHSGNRLFGNHPIEPLGNLEILEASGSFRYTFEGFNEGWEASLGSQCWEAHGSAWLHFTGHQWPPTFGCVWK